MEILELKNTLTEITKRMDLQMEETEERIGEPEDITIEITWSEQQRANRLEKNEQSLMNFWHHNKRYSIHGCRILGGEGWLKKYFKKKMAENFPNLAKDINLQIPEADQTPKDKPKEIH